MLWEEYDLCRQKQFVIFKKPADRTGKKEKFVAVEYPVGFSALPSPGGMENQPYRKMRIFGAFLRGERRGCGKAMSK